MEDYQYLLPEESGEMTLETVESLREIEKQLRHLFQSHHYREVMPPTFEYTDLYDKLGTDFKSEKMFQLINHEGKSVAMRYDFTIPLTRTYALSNSDEIARFSYFGKVFRKEKRYKGRQTEYYQIGTELFGGSELTSDQECLNLAREVLQILPLENTIIELGSASFYKRLCALVGTENHAELTQIFSRKDLSKMRKFVKNQTFSDGLSQLLLQVLLTDEIDELSNLIKATQDKELLAAFDAIVKVYDVIQDEDKDGISFDLGMMPLMTYYSGLIFKVYSDLAAQPIISGGRYDELPVKFQKKVGATGFCCHMDTVVKALSESGGKHD